MDLHVPAFEVSDRNIAYATNEERVVRRTHNVFLPYGDLQPIFAGSIIPASSYSCYTLICLN
jgi:hypothetical protein